MSGQLGLAHNVVSSEIIKPASKYIRIFRDPTDQKYYAKLPDGTIEIIGPDGAGDITNGANVGTGNGVFKDKFATILRFKSLKAGPNITLTPSADEIEIEATNGGAGAPSVLYRSTGDSNIVSNVAGEVTFTTSSFAMPVTPLVVGNKILFRGYGVFSTPGGVNSFTLRLRNSAGVLKSLFRTLFGPNVDKAWYFEFIVDFRSIGAGGTVSAWGKYTTHSNGLTGMDGVLSQQIGALPSWNTTIIQGLSLTGEWVVPTAARKIQIQQLYYELI